MLLDAVVLAGGRSSRLAAGLAAGLAPGLASGLASGAGSPAKALLRIGGKSLLELAVSAACVVARNCVVVGPTDGHRLPDAALVTRETPHFAGPAAAIAAGVAHLNAAHVLAGTANADAVLVIACDMPGIASHLSALVEALESVSPTVDGVVSVDDNGHRQPLASLYRAGALRRSIGRFTDATLINLSVRELIAPLNLISLPAANGATDDVDTWEDAARLGATELAT